MAIINNNVQNVKFLRNGSLYGDRNAALAGLNGQTLAAEQDGSLILARYGSGDAVKTLVGVVYVNGSNKSLTIFDIDGASADVEELRQEINAKLGTGVTSANTATAQLAALRGNAQSTSAETSVEGAKRYADQILYDTISALDYSGITTSNAAVVTNVTEADGKVAATSANVGNLKLTDYTKGSDSGSVAATDSINAAVAKLENQIDAANDNVDAKIDALDGTITADTGYYINKVDEVDGKISGTTAALPTVAAISETGKPITAVSESLGAISATAGTIDAQYVNINDAGGIITATNVEGALAEIAAEIDGMNLPVVSGDGNVITAVSESNGVVNAEKTAIKDVKLTGYQKTSATGAISATDDIEDALSKLENKAAAITIANADHSINVTTAASGTDIAVNIKSGEKVIKLGNDGIYTNLNLVEITGDTLPAEIKVRYELRDSDNAKIGESIDIPKDSHIVSINYITGGTHAQNLEYVYIDVSGNTQTTYVDMSALVLEAEFESGVTVDAGSHIVHGVVDQASEKNSGGTDFLTVGADGFKVSGIKQEIIDRINELDSSVTGGATAGTATSNHIQVVVDEADGKLTAVTVTETNIADKTKLEELSAKTVTEVASSNESITAALSAATDGTKHLDIITDASKIKMTGFTSTDVLSGINATSSVTEAFKEVDKVITDNEEVVSAALNDLNERIDELSGGTAGDLAAEIAARKAVDGQTGQTYTANSGKAYISGATSLNDADIKLNDALAALDADVIKQVKVNGITLGESSNAVNVKISSTPAPGTSASPIEVGSDLFTGGVALQISQIDCGTY